MRKIKWGLLETLSEYKKLASGYNEFLKPSGFEVEQVLFKQDPENPLKEIEQGNLDIYQVTSTQLFDITERPWLKIWDFPFIFRNKEHVEKYIGSEQVQANLKELETEHYIPVTYSYAGGFCYVIKEKNKPVELYNNLPYTYIQNKTDEEIKQMESTELPLPHSILAYEVNEYTLLKQSVREKLELELSNHMIVSRVTFISKKLYNELGQDNFNQLVSILNGERQKIYDIAEEKLKMFLQSGLLQSREVAEDEKAMWRAHIVSSNRILNKEIDFVQKL